MVLAVGVQHFVGFLIVIGHKVQLKTICNSQLQKSNIQDNNNVGEIKQN
jgi:hypothetical protein